MILLILIPLLLLILLLLLLLLLVLLLTLVVVSLVPLVTVVSGAHARLRWQSGHGFRRLRPAMAPGALEGLGHGGLGATDSRGRSL